MLRSAPLVHHYKVCHPIHSVQAIRSTAGFHAIDTTICAEMRAWLLGVARARLAAMGDTSGGGGRCGRGGERAEGKEEGEEEEARLTLLSNVALLMRTHGLLREAEQLMRRALARAVTLHGEGSDHPDALVVQHNLAELLAATNRPAEVRRLPCSVVQRIARSQSAV